MVQPLNLQVFARVEQIAGNLQLEQVERKSSEDALSNRLDSTSARLDTRVDAIAHDVQQERDTRTAADNALSQRLDGTNRALDAQAARLDGRVDTVAGDLQTEQDARTVADDALSNRLVGTNAELNHQATRLDGRVDAVAGDLRTEQQARTAADDALSRRIDDVSGNLQKEQNARTAADAAFSARLDDIKAELDGQIADLREEIEELEDLIAYFEYCAFAAKSPFRELLGKLGITTVEQLAEREPAELHPDMSRITEQEPQYQAIPAVRRPRVTDEIIRLSRPPRSPSGDNGRPEGDRSASPDRRRRPGGRGTQTG